VTARIESLKRRACRPELVDDSILRNGFGSVLLPAREALVATALVNRHPHPVSREQLETLLWPDGQRTARALEDLVYRLRRRIKPLHLAISYSRATGFAIGVATETTPRPPTTETPIGTGECND
jgi:DNA-binding winged helix-turn-helix (wHTH) protein